MESSAAEEVPAELSRRQRRRELDARRSRCRIRLGGHLERWCRLKDQLGFALHSQLAQFLLDRFSSSAGPPAAPSPGSLQRLVALSHGHGRSCSFVPAVQPPPGPPHSLGSLEWACVAGHSFSWRLSDITNDITADVTTCQRPEDTGGRLAARSPARDEPRDGGDAVGVTADDTGPREPPRSDGDGSAEGAEPRGDDDVCDDIGDDTNDDISNDVNDDLAYADDPRDENYQPSIGSDSQPKRRQNQPRTRKKVVKEEPPVEPSLSEPSLSKPGLSEPSPEEKLGRLGCGRREQAGDEDAAQIGPKRIRKAAKREILLCDFAGCGKIFSNRQYLNHHQKYQHVHQKTFACSQPGCGKSFNFKKHLKEHEKLHSDQRDYICEFCARPFRTSSNLLIHRRIHTGEKPLQCDPGTANPSPQTPDPAPHPLCTSVTSNPGLIRFCFTSNPGLIRFCFTSNPGLIPFCFSSNPGFNPVLFHLNPGLIRFCFTSNPGFNPVLFHLKPWLNPVLFHLKPWA